MASLNLPDQKQQLTEFSKIKAFLNERGIELERWEANCELKSSDSQETILAAYEHKLKPFMQANGFETADVINVHPEIEGIEAIAAKFLSEHTHSEDEVRFFVDGEGDFWFNREGEVFCVTCEKGDFISVPAGVKHWFNMAPNYSVKAIRIFSNQEGWVPHYTESGVDKRYLQ